MLCFPLFAPQPKGSLTSENWHKPYADALMEVEPPRLSRLIVEAERAIFVRYLELSPECCIRVDRSEKIDWKSCCRIRGISLNSWVTLLIKIRTADRGGLSFALFLIIDSELG